MLSLLIAACALLRVATSANASSYVVTLEEVGSNVVATGSGEIDLSGLNYEMTVTLSVPGLFPNFPGGGGAAIHTGTGPEDVYSAVTWAGPTSFGGGLGSPATSAAGGAVGLVTPPPGSPPPPFNSLIIEVPQAYTFGTVIFDSATYNNATFASLGLTPGTYVWTWGAGPDQRFTLEIGPTPLPAALPLFATGLGGLGLLGWRRKRKNTAALAAA